MPELPTLTRQGRLMLAAFGERSTLEDFKVAVDMRPEIDYSLAECEVGLEALTTSGLLKRKGEEWEITKLGRSVLAAPLDDASGPPSAVVLEPQPGTATTNSEG